MSCDDVTLPAQDAEEWRAAARLELPPEPEMTRLEAEADEA